MIAHDVQQNTEEDFAALVPGIYPNLRADLYHATKAVSSSMLKAVETNSAKYAKGVMDGVVKMDGEALKLGAAAHCFALTPTAFDREFVLGEQCTATVKTTGSRCNNDGIKCINGEWVCGVHGKGLPCDFASTGAKVLKVDEYRRVKGIHSSMWATPEIVEIMEFASDFELSVLWIDEETGLPCKARYDILCRDLMLFPDLKTCRALKFFEWDANTREYGIQLAHYRRGAIVHGLADIANVIAIESDGVFDAGVFPPTQKFMDDGLKNMAANMRVVKQCFETGVWPGFCKGKVPLRTKDEIRQEKQS